jgi:hypothetical protein
MQNSELYRRSFVLPLDEAAEIALFNNNGNEKTIVEKYEFPDEITFENLWNSGLFSKINLELGTFIDDYCDEIIPAKSLPILAKIVSEFRNGRNIEVGENTAIKALAFLCDLGIDLNRSLFFVL